MRDIKNFSTFNNSDELNETKEERKLKKAARKAKRAKKTESRKKKAESKGKTRKVKRLNKKIDKKKDRIVRLSDRFNEGKTSKRRKIKAIRSVKSVVKTAISNIKRNKVEKNNKTIIENYENDLKILDFLIKVVRHDMGDESVNDYISKLKSEDVIELLEKALEKAEDEGNISDTEIADATGGLVTHLPSNEDEGHGNAADNKILDEIRKHFLDVKDTFKYKVSKNDAPLLDTSLVKESLEVVKFIQYMMNKLGYNADIEDGKYGKITKSAVIKFQKNYGLNTVGEVDTETWKKILTLLRIPYNKDFNVYTINNIQGGVTPTPNGEDLMARLKKWLKL